jgi:3-hydroxyacyl-CoA dehydrogenase
MGEAVSIHRDAGVAIILIDEPPANAMTEDVRRGLGAALDAAEADLAAGAIVLGCAGPDFIAGADLKTIDAAKTRPSLPDLIDRIERFAKPVVAAVAGRALGGGVEVLLACHARVAAPDARFGLPEVSLGLIPGAGGTVRLPRLVGLATTIRLAVEGRQIGAEEALAVGLVDVVAREDLLATATDHARSLIEQAPRRTRDLPPPPLDEAALAAAAETAAKRQRGRRAPHLALESIRFGLTHPIDEALAHEHRLCLDALGSEESRALRHLFAAERAVRKMPADAQPRAVRTVAVIGLGTMGRGIVQTLAAAGLAVIAVARDDAALGKARAAVETAWAKIDPPARAAQEALVRWSATLSDVADADLVVEAIRESVSDKTALFAELGRVARPGAILASNTSYLDIDVLGEAPGRRADVAGLHFFNPPTAMRLVEIVVGRHTAPDVTATLVGLARTLGKVPVRSGVCDGFIVNRLLAKRSREAYFLLEEGASPYAIDRVMTDFGFPLGPFALGDLAGIDVQYAARRARAHSFTEREHRAEFVDQLHALGRLGRRSGSGWYAYPEGGGKPQPDPEIGTLLARHAARHGLRQRQIEDDEVRDRLILAMVNEGARLIDEGIVAGPAEIDVALVHGIGFPAHLGGPMWWADGQGLDGIVATLSRFMVDQGGDLWQPAAGLMQRAAQGRSFY